MFLLAHGRWVFLLGVGSAVVGALALIGLLGQGSERSSGSLGAEPELVVFAGHGTILAGGDQGDSAGTTAARAVLEQYSPKYAEDMNELRAELTPGKLLVLDGTAIKDLDVEFLRKEFQGGRPVFAFNVPLRDLAELTGYFAYEGAFSPDDAAFPKVPEGDHYSYVYALTDASGVRRSGFAQGDFRESEFRIFETRLRQMALTAKGLTYDPTSGGQVIPIEYLNTPPAGLDVTPPEGQQTQPGASEAAYLAVDALPDNGAGPCDPVDENLAAAANTSVDLALCLINAGATPVNAGFNTVTLRLSYTGPLGATNAASDLQTDLGGNPDWNEAELGGATAWDCNLLNTQATAPRAAPSPATITCTTISLADQAVSGSVLLATLTLDAIAPGIAELSWGTATSILAGSTEVTCSDGITCLGASIVVQ